MPRVLFDKNVPYPLKRQLPSGYRVKTAEEEGWGQVSNGELISCAEKFGYQILLTCDQNVRYQQKPDRPANLDDRSGIEYLVGGPAEDRRYRGGVEKVSAWFF